jgi:hypothetical protein
LFTRALGWAARTQPTVLVKAPMCVQATIFARRKQLIVHLFNGLNTTANHGLPAADVPLREEAVPVAGIEVRFTGLNRPTRFRCEPGHCELMCRDDGATTVVQLPPLSLQMMLIASTD